MSWTADSYPERTNKMIQSLLERVRNLDRDARARLSHMLDEDMDLPYLDLLEREYARAFRTVAPEQAVQLRGRFVRALNEQREFLLDMVREVLAQQDDNDLHSASADMNFSA